MVIYICAFPDILGSPSPHIGLCNRSHLNFLIYEENFDFLFISAMCFHCFRNGYNRFLKNTVYDPHFPYYCKTKVGALKTAMRNKKSKSSVTLIKHCKICKWMCRSLRPCIITVQKHLFHLTTDFFPFAMLKEKQNLENLDMQRLYTGTVLRRSETKFLKITGVWKSADHYSIKTRRMLILNL
jgi:hypothetical protein